MLKLTVRSTLDCLACRRFEAELARLKRIHSEKMGELCSNTHWINPDEFHRLEMAENEARTKLETAQRELHEHQRVHQNDN